MHNRPVLIILACLFLLLGGCEAENPSGKPMRKAPDASSAVGPKAEAGTIVALGDSLTAGLGVEEGDAYPARLQRRLQADGYDFRVINAGVSGETTSGTLSRLEWVLTMQPDIVILEIGANDGLRGIDPGVPAQNIREIIRILQERGVIVVFAGMKMVRNLGPDYTTAFNALYPEIAREFDLIFMPFFLDGVATVRELNIEDGLHPNATGYEMIVDNLYPHVLVAIDRFKRQRKKG